MMNNKLIQKPLVVKKSPIHGYGVFAGKNFSLNEVIEECYTLVTHAREVELNDYYFKANDKSGLPLGFGGIYNHSDEPNATYSFDAELKLLVFSAIRFIPKGEEILISYGESWFDSRNTQANKISKIRRFWRYFSGFPLRALLVCMLVVVIRLTLSQLP